MADVPSLESHRAAVRRVLRAERARSGLTFADISRRLAEYGIEQSASNLSNKISAGQLEAALLFAVLDVLGVTQVRIPDLIEDARRPM